MSASSLLSGLAGVRVAIVGDLMLDAYAWGDVARISPDAPVPVVDVQHPKAHVTHEAAIGSVDTKQLETLMSRGLTEDEAVELIIQGLLT